MRRFLFCLVFLLSITLISCSGNSVGPNHESGNGNGGGVGHNNPTTYTVTVNVKPSGAGTISPAAKGTYNGGKTIQLKATPNNGYVFNKWSGDIKSTDNPYSLTVDKDYQITAHFKLNLTIKTDGKGTVEQEVIKTTGKSGPVVKLTAKPHDGWKFVTWKGDLNSTDNPVTITIDKAKKVTAVFKKKNFKLTVKTIGKGGVTKDPNQTTYKYKTTVKLTAEPDKGHEFVKWKGDLSSTDNPVTITIDKTTTITAVFQSKTSVVKIDFQAGAHTTGRDNRPVWNNTIGNK